MDDPHAEVEIKPQLKPRGSVAKIAISNDHPILMFPADMGFWRALCHSVHQAAPRSAPSLSAWLPGWSSTAYSVPQMQAFAQVVADWMGIGLRGSRYPRL